MMHSDLLQLLMLEAPQPHCSLIQKLLTLLLELILSFQLHDFKAAVCGRRLCARQIFFLLSKRSKSFSPPPHAPIHIQPLVKRASRINRLIITMIIMRLRSRSRLKSCNPRRNEKGRRVEDSGQARAPPLTFSSPAANIGHRTGSPRWVTPLGHVHLLSYSRRQRSEG